MYCSHVCHPGLSFLQKKKLGWWELVFPVFVMQGRDGEESTRARSSNGKGRGAGGGGKLAGWRCGVEVWGALLLDASGVQQGMGATVARGGVGGSHWRRRHVGGSPAQGLYIYLLACLYDTASLPHALPHTRATGDHIKGT